MSYGHWSGCSAVVMCGMTITQNSGALLGGKRDGTGKPRILVIDDDPRIGEVITRTLTLGGYAIDFSDSGWSGLRQAVHDRYDLLILDLILPDMDGRAVLTAIMQQKPGQAVLVLSCIGEVPSKVECLDLGAQDYLTKPFSLDELLARVRARLRQRPAPPGGRVMIPDVPCARPGGGSGGPAGILRAGGLAVDVMHLRADAGHGPVTLTRLEFLLLRELMEHLGHLVPKGRLLESVWGYEFDPGSNVVDVCVRRLRRKLGFSLIKTVRGQGYQLEAP